MTKDDDQKQMFSTDMVDASKPASDIIDQLSELLDEYPLPEKYGDMMVDPDFTDVDGELLPEPPDNLSDLQLHFEFEVADGTPDTETFTVVLTYPNEQRLIDISVVLSAMPSPRGISKLTRDALNEDDREKFVKKLASMTAPKDTT